MAENATIQIPKDMLEPAIQAQVSKALVEALNIKGDLLGALAEKILSQPVDSSGKASTYSNDRERTWLRYIIEMMTREAVIEAIKVQTDEFRANVRAAVEKELKKPNSRLVKEISEGAASAVMNAANSPWHINVSFDRKG